MSTLFLPHPNFLPYVVGAHGVFSQGLGLAALYNPLQFVSAFNLQNKIVTAESRKVAHDLLIVYGARDIALGFGLSSAAYYGHKQIMGWSMLGVSCIAFLDGLVSRSNEKGGEFKHWVFVGVSWGVAAFCFEFL